MTSQLPAVFIKATHHEPGSGDLTGLGFTIKFGLATAVVSIQERPPVPFEDRIAAYQAVIEDLAQALLQTVQNPQCITENPETRG
jgi:hypothetical protein